MRCPVCGADVTLHLVVPELAEDEPVDDPLAPVLRRLEAERYGSPEPIPPRRRNGPDPADPYGTSR